MLFSGLTTLRRLALLAVVIFITAVVFLRNSDYSEYLPRYGTTTSPGSAQKSGLEEDQQAPSRVEIPGGSGLNVPPGLRPSPANPTGTEEIENAVKPEATSIPNSLHTSTSPPPAASGTSTAPPAAQSYAQVQAKIQELIKSWSPPKLKGHWPGYDAYFDKDYDPNRWEGFEWDHDFYINNGIRQLKEVGGVESEPYLPYPEYNSPEWQALWQGSYVPCEGARGRLLNDSSEDAVRAYPAVPEGFPAAAIGDANVTGIDVKHCFDRYHRLGAYGFGQASAEHVDDWQRPLSRPDWSSVPWGQLQNQCLNANKNRYRSSAGQAAGPGPSKNLPPDVSKASFEDPEPLGGPPSHHHRTAVLIRTWEGYDYTENDMQTIRALVTELSLLSGGEYQVFLFVNVKDKSADIFNNPQEYDDILRRIVPPELRSMSILWSEAICEEWYPEIGDWQVYWHQFMPLQWFSKTYPEFDFVWNWETDARYTGNHYQFLEAIAAFAKKTPRKYMWERNQRFYFPAAHGTWEQWLADTDATIERGMREGVVDPVWGPKPYSPAAQTPIGPTPPRSMKDDQFEWGVDEEADLITLQPIWDPTHTEWSYRDKIWNFIPGVRPHFSAEDVLDEGFHHTEFANIPRRTYINTLSRFSKRQLHAMHVENSAGRTTQAEMWPATVALQHGLKAVYAPHPIWTDRKWPAWYLDAIFNADGGQTAGWGGAADSVYNHDREHNFAGWSWYYATTFPTGLYRRWLGWMSWDDSAVSGLGGKTYEDTGLVVDLLNGRLLDIAETASRADGEGEGSGDGVKRQLMTGQVDEARVVGGRGRMCLPPMLLHPVKNVREDAQTPPPTPTPTPGLDGDVGPVPIPDPSDGTNPAEAGNEVPQTELEKQREKLEEPGG